MTAFIFIPIITSSQARVESPFYRTVHIQVASIDEIAPFEPDAVWDDAVALGLARIPNPPQSSILRHSGGSCLGHCWSPLSPAKIRREIELAFAREAVFKEKEKRP